MSPKTTVFCLEALSPKGVPSIRDENLTGVIIADYRGDVNTMWRLPAQPEYIRCIFLHDSSS